MNEKEQVDNIPIEDEILKSKKEKENVLMQVPVTGEITLEDVCDKECRKLRALLYLLEEEFDTKMVDHPEIRKYILDSANFIKRFPNMISEIIKVKSNENS